MSLPHFFAGAPEPGSPLSLSEEDARHAVSSLRLRPGDRLTSSDGRGGLAVCRVTRADRSGLTAEVEDRSHEPAPRPVLTVSLAPPKGDRLSWALQKLTEVGVDAVVLVEAARSVRRWGEGRAARARERAESIAREAAKQSRRRHLPDVRGPLSWDDALTEALGGGPVAVLWEWATEGLDALLPPETPERLTLMVGPEGGIPAEDAEAARDRGALLASLGATILRTETAALVGATVALARYGRLGSTRPPPAG